MTRPDAPGVHFAAPKVTQGGQALDESHVVTQPSATSVEFGEEVSEALQTTKEGVLQSWRFRSPPTSAGDLLVRIEVDAPFQGSTSRGLRFGTPGAIVVYSHATWLDATRRATHVPAVFRGGAIELRVPQAVVATSRFPAVLDPTISPEFVAALPVAAQLSGIHERPTATWNGNGWTAVWLETTDAGVRLLTTRLSPEGVHEQLGRHQVATGLVGHRPAAIASSEDGRAVAVWESAAGEVRATRLASDGGAIDELLLDRGTAPDITWAGGSYVATWLAGLEVRASRLPAAGPLDAGWFLISADAGGPPRLAHDGAQTVVVWSSLSADIVGSRLSSGDRVLDVPAFPITATPTLERDPAVSCRQGTCFVAWLDASSHVLGARVQGTLVSAPALELENAESAERVRVTSRASDFVVAWDQRSPKNISLRRVERAGALHPQGTVRLRSLDADQFVGLASHDEQALLLWERLPSLGFTPFAVAQVLDQQLAGRSFVLQRDSQAGRQFAAFVTASRDQYLVSWMNVLPARMWNENTEIVAVRLDPHGRPLDPGGVLLSDLPLTSANPTVPISMASDGTGFFIAWSQGFYYAWVTLDANGDLQGKASPNMSEIYASLAPAAVTAPLGYSLFWRSRFGLTVEAVDVSPLAAYGNRRLFMSYWFTCVSGASAPASSVVLWTMQSPVVHLHASHDAGVSDLEVELPISSITCPRVGIGAATVLVAGANLDGGGVARLVELDGDAGALFPLVRFPSAIAWNGSQFVSANRTATELISLDGGRSTVPFASDGVACREGQCLVIRSEFLVDGGAVPIAAVLLSDTQLPLAAAQTVTTPEDTALAVVLSGTDPEGAPLTTFVNSPPTNGRLSGQPPNVTYTPDRDFFGQDSFSFVVSDGLSRSLPATVTVNVSPVNDAPVVESRTVTTAQQPLSVTLSGVDVDGDPLSWQIVTAPDAGVLSGVPPTLSYVPNPAFIGTDGFRFVASDGTAQSNVGLVIILVTAAPDAGAGGGTAGGGTAGGGTAGGGTAGGGTAGGGTAGGGAAAGGTAAGGTADGGTTAGGTAAGGTAGGTVRLPAAGIEEQPLPPSCGCSSSGDLFVGLLAMMFAVRRSARGAQT